MTRKISFIAIAIGFIFFLSSCKKDNQTQQPGNENTNNANSELPVLEKPYGILMASNGYMLVNQMGIEMAIGTEVYNALFFEHGEVDTVFYDAGEVKANEIVLEKDESNKYTAMTINPLTPITKVNWSVTGSANVTAFTKNIDRIPKFSEYALLPSTISKNADLHINLTGKISNADTVFLMLSDMEGNVLIRKGDINSIHFVFSKNDLMKLKGDNFVLNLVCVNIALQVIDKKNYYFVNNSTYTRMNITNP